RDWSSDVCSSDLDLGGEFSDRPGLDEGGEALVRGRTRDVDAFGQLAHAQAGILDEGGDDAAVDVVEIECHGRSFTVDIGVLSAPGRTAPGGSGGLPPLQSPASARGASQHWTNSVDRSYSSDDVCGAYHVPLVTGDMAGFGRTRLTETNQPPVDYETEVSLQVELLHETK